MQEFANAVFKIMNTQQKGTICTRSQEQTSDTSFGRPSINLLLQTVATLNTLMGAKCNQKRSALLKDFATETDAQQSLCVQSRDIPYKERRRTFLCDSFYKFLFISLFLKTQKTACVDNSRKNPIINIKRPLPSMHTQQFYTTTLYHNHKPHSCTRRKKVPLDLHMQTALLRC